jgi:hypothetical protein
LLDRALISPPGDHRASKCLLSLLAGWARADALVQNIDQNTPLGRRMAVMLGAWRLTGFADAVAVAATDVPADDKDLLAIKAWFRRLVEDIKAEFTPPAEPRPRKDRWLDVTANHSHWAAFAVGSAAVVLQDRRGMDFAMGELRKALAIVDPDGYFPSEIKRGGRAVQYQNLAMDGVAGLMSLADANGVALTRDQEAAFRRAARASLESVLDPGRLKARTGAEQVVNDDMLVWTDMALGHLRRTAPDLAARIDREVASKRPFKAPFTFSNSSLLYATVKPAAEHAPGGGK